MLGTMSGVSCIATDETPESLYIIMEMVGLYFEAFFSLEEQDQKIYRKRFVEEKSILAISGEIGLTRRLVEASLFRSRDFILDYVRSYLESSEGEPFQNTGEGFGDRSVIEEYRMGGV